MNSNRSEGSKYLRASLEVDGAILSQSRAASIWLNIALAEEHDNKDEAVTAAKKAIELSTEDSPQSLQAQALIAELILDEPESSSALRDIEKKARKFGQTSVANNILLTMAEKSEEPKEEAKFLKTVLETKQSGYNHYRAIVSKAELMEKMESVELDGPDVRALTKAYSYLHAQRFGSLFDRAHDALWVIFERSNNQSQLLRLFRHSSFLWRIRGEERRETRYLRKLETYRHRLKEESGSPKTVQFEMGYFLRRLKLLLLGNEKD